MKFPATPSRATGVLLVVASAITFSFAGIFTNGVSADAWSIIFWRGLAAVSFTTLFMIASRSLFSEIRAFGLPALMVTVLSAAGTAAFIPAFKYSSVANVVLIYAVTPFISAGLSWVFLKEAPTRTVVLASIASFSGVLFIVFGSLGTGNIIGDILALIMSLMMAGIMVIYRKWPSTTAALPAMLSSAILLPVSIIFGAPFLTPTKELPILFFFGLIFAFASVTLSEGARRLPASETALLSTLETPVAPVLAYLILREIPSAQAVFGGSIILLAVIWSQLKR